MASARKTKSRSKSGKKSRGKVAVRKATAKKKAAKKKTAVRKRASRRKPSPAAGAKKAAIKARARKSPAAAVPRPRAAPRAARAELPSIEARPGGKIVAVAECVEALMDRLRPGWSGDGKMGANYRFDMLGMSAFLGTVRNQLRAHHYALNPGDHDFVRSCLDLTVSQLKIRIADKTTEIPRYRQSRDASPAIPLPSERGRRGGTKKAAPRKAAAAKPAAAPARPPPAEVFRPRLIRQSIEPPSFSADASEPSLEPTDGSNGDEAVPSRAAPPPDSPAPFSPEATPVPPQAPRQPRYANAVLLEQHGDRPIDKRANYFMPGMLVRLRLDIGQLSAESQVENPTAFPADKLLKDVDLDVMVSSTDFGVAIDAKSLENARPSIANGYFSLPADGGPARTRGGSKELFFFLELPPDQRLWHSRNFHARIGYYYRNILIQSQHLTVSPGKKINYTIVTDFTTSDDLTGLDVIPERPRLSIFTNANDDGNHQIVLRSPGGTATAPASSATLEMNSTTVGATIKMLRGVLSKRAPVQKLRNRNEFVDDLRQLAPIGWNLYNLLPGQLPPDFFGNLQLNPDSAVIQVGRPNTSSFVLPWSYIYEIPLFSGVTPTLCPMVERWDGRSPLFADAPRQCPCGPHDHDVLCPFGFWGYRYAIEQLSSSDKPVLTIPAAVKSNVVIAETQFDVDLAALSNHVSRLNNILGGMPLNAQLKEGKDRASIETLLGADLPFVYFYCHGQRLNGLDPNTYLGVGKRETITAQDITGWTAGWYKKLQRLIWGSVRPLIFINACHSLAIEPETLVSYLQAFVGRGRAAGVIGTEVKVEQSMAMDVAEKFIAGWMSGAQSVDEALRAIRIDYLKQGNLFGLVYTPYCWSELKIMKP